MTTPLVSVVTSVFNGGLYLRPSLESLLTQEGVDFEVIIVDDGSTDDSPALLDELVRRDARVRLLRQPNQGLTRALIRGCSEACGEFIARHDADDLSLAGRLTRQVEMLRADPRMAFVSCWTQTIGPEDELLFETRRPLDPAEATRRLTDNGEGPCHGSVMFRADAYRRAGGYRGAFRFTQDWDLWLRLAEVGLLGYVPDFLFAFRVSDTAISAQRRQQQLRLHQAALRCREARKRGESEQSWLEEAAGISAEPPSSARRSSAASAYFIGKCLLDRHDARAWKYLRRCVREEPWAWRHWVALAASAVLCR